MKTTEEIIADLINAAQSASSEHRNFSGMSDDSEPVLSSSTRRKLDASVAQAKEHVVDFRAQLQQATADNDALKQMFEANPSASWAQVEQLRCALTSVVNSGPLNNGLRDDNTMALARAAIDAAKNTHPSTPNA